MLEYEIRDRAKAPDGKIKIEWVSKNMPLLYHIKEDFKKHQYFKGLNVTVCVHLEAKTAYLSTILAAGGANVALCGSNPLSTQDDVAAALVDMGIHVYSYHNATDEEYDRHLNMALDINPNIIIDDGGDLVEIITNRRPELLENLYGGCEETTTGVLRLRAKEKEGSLRFPMIAVNDAQCKYLFDNRYGTGQSVWDGINRTTNLIVAGKTVVVAGYGWCGKGVSMRAKGFGAKVVVCEVDPIKAIEAVMDGFTVMKMDDAAKIGDLFITVTGCDDVINENHFPLMKDGAILCNAGHFDVEVNVTKLTKMAVERKIVKQNIMGYKLKNGRIINVIAEGRLVNLAAGDGHPAEIMDMSFAIQALSSKYLAHHHSELAPRVYTVPKEIDESVARLKLQTLGVSIDTLTKEQYEYLYGKD